MCVRWLLAVAVGVLASSTACGGSLDGHPGAATGSDAQAGGGNGADRVDPGPVSGPGGSPTIGGCPVFPPENPWNTPIDKAPRHPNADAFSAGMNPTKALHADWGNWSTDHYGIPWAVVPADQATVSFTFDYADESDPGPYPIPAGVRIEGGGGSDGDRHILLVQQGSCTLFETFGSDDSSGMWTAGSGAIFDLNSNMLRPDGWTSADAAGLPILPGLVRYDEVAAGAINHAIRFTMDHTQNAYIHPATHAASSQTDAGLPPMGLRVRLKAGTDASAFSGPSLVIFTALKTYGLILADNGSDWYVTGDSDDRWDPLIDDINGALKSLHGSDFEAVDTGDPIMPGEN